MGLAVSAVSALLLALALSGCGSAKQAAEPAHATGDETHGVLVGLITDDESQPLGEAAISLKAVKAAPIQIRILSNSEGRFRLENVPMGKQTIIANKPGYNEAASTVTILPGTETTIRMVLTIKPVDQYKIVSLSPISGRYDCAADYVVASGECDYEVYNHTGQKNVPFTDNNNATFQVPSGWGGILFEIRWDTGTQPVGVEGIRFQLESQEDLGGMFIKLVARDTPMRASINAGEVAPDATLGYPMPQRGVGTWIHVLPLGTADGGTCAVQCGYGVGVAVQLKYDVFITVFYGGRVDPAYSGIPK
jgi:hypothetical protein